MTATLRRILAGTFGAIFIAAGVMPGLARADAGIDGDPVVPNTTTPASAELVSLELFDYVFELEQGENRDVHAEWLLNELGVPESEWGFAADSPDGRRVYDYECSINGLWLRLTDDEADEADLIQRAGVVGGQRAFSVRTEAIVGEPYTGPQVAPTGYNRVGGAPIAPEAIDEVTGGADVDIAIIDTGIDKFHEDLTVVGGFDATFDGITGIRPPESWQYDGYGHGTHVAGSAAAIDNGIGVTGLAAGARLWSVPVLNEDGVGSMASVLAGIDWTVCNASQIEVANLSLGGANVATEAYQSDAMHNAIANGTKAGVVFVVAAGNDGADALTQSPANYSEAVTVAAVTDYDGLPGGLAVPPADIPSTYRDDFAAGFSNYGSIVDVAAPGVRIFSTLPGSTYGYADGTSMASPHVAGVIAEYVARTGDEEHAVEAVLAWSSMQGWQVRSGYESYRGGALPPMVRFGAPAFEEGK